jgi:uncharacterized protein YacL
MSLWIFRILAVLGISFLAYNFVSKDISGAAWGALCGFIVICIAECLRPTRRNSLVKVADISAVIDGRIVDLCETGFLSGIVVVPQFVINALNDYASSKDSLERAKGRRGLDIITRLKELKSVETRVINRAAKAMPPEEKVVEIANYLKGQIVTTDFNVNKAAARTDTPVLNIRDLTTALKPVILPGEDMSVFIMRDGKEKEQGIGYLDDGAMIVVEEGKKYIGKRVDVCVYSILQTSAGRMIFSKVKPRQAENQ